MGDVDKMMNWGMGIGALFAMAIQKFTFAYVIFTFLLGWTILSNFVTGDPNKSINATDMLYLFFNIILFFSTLYLTVISLKNKKLFDGAIDSGDLPFYIKTSNLLILFIFLFISLNKQIVRQLEDMLPNCGNVVMLLSIFLFTYLLGVMVVNISIIINKKITDG
tara:strand:- start:88 stop:579 length:492 start_codon:yes stop_codon:yes gene_type:complete